MKENMKKTRLRGVLMLLLTAFIWGTAFAAQSVGMESVQAFTFSGIRTLMGAAVLLPVVLVRIAVRGARADAAQRAALRAATVRTVRCGLLLGAVFCAAGNLQQFAFYWTPSGKIAFITALYMFFVPLLGLLFRKRVPLLTWLCVAVGFLGLYFLCVNPADLGAVNRGDLLTVACAVVFAVHILLVERFAPECDGLLLSCVQFAVSGVLSCALMFLFESPDPAAIRAALMPLLYAGVMSCGVAYTFQILGQRYTEATVASLLMCTESVFGALTGALLLHERLSPREILGCAVMFAAILLSQLAEPITGRLRSRGKKAAGG